MEASGASSRTNTLRPFCTLAAASVSDSTWTMRARTSSPSALACSVTSTSAPFSKRSRYWPSPSWKMIASYWPLGSESWMTPSLFPVLVRRSWRSMTLAPSRAVVAPARTARAKSAQRVARSRFSAAS